MSIRRHSAILAQRDLFVSPPASAPPTAPTEAEEVFAVRNLAFDCPGCDERVGMAVAPSNHPLRCERCSFWGVQTHRRLRELQAWFAAEAARGAVHEGEAV